MPVLGRRHLFLYHCLIKIDADNPVNLSTLNKRVEFQKKVYLLIALGVPLDYSFGSYIKGPYSTSLTRVGYTIYESPKEAIPTDLSSIVPLSESDLEKIEILKNLMDDFPEKDNAAYWLELISSIHFLLTQAYPPVRQLENVKKRLSIWKPLKFDNDDVDYSIELMQKYGLV